ncbi:cache domain-containing protein [Salisediminibacterium selenitireducens]|uniref:cache domain-containing protein n=1 Tax=Salisediminibacterium selenitireducens TaxID=85683 RepID=UPI00015F97A3|nr:cache domain-containing protein [Salisediminibacterium selenitireducens]
MSPPYTDFGTGEAVVTFSAPLLPDHEQGPPGAVAIDIFLADIQEELQTYGAGETGYVSLMDDTGTPLFHPDEAVLEGQKTDPLLPPTSDMQHNTDFAEQDGHLI